MPTDYKALVCIFMFGGNDANNMIVPLDNYANYATNRGLLALSQAQLLQITTKGLASYGLHPNLGSAQPNQTSLYSLFRSGALAVVANVGTLTAPIKKADYLAGTRPNQLFSHSDQQAQWQTSISTASSATGWGGRIADVTRAAGTTFPAICSVAGVSVFSQGAITQPLAIAPAPTPLNQTLRLVKPDTAIQQILYDRSKRRCSHAGARFRQPYPVRAQQQRAAQHKSDAHDDVSDHRAWKPIEPGSEVDQPAEPVWA